jgi:hypothetical protein
MDAYLAGWFGQSYPNFDIVSFHYYDYYGGDESVPEAFEANYLPLIYGVTQKYPVSSLPIWNTEGSDGGPNTAGTLTNDQQTGFVARRAILYWSSGVQRFHWYAFDQGSTDVATFINNGSLTIAANAYQYLYNWMVGASMPSPCNLNGGTFLDATYTCDIFRNGGYHGQFVWNNNTCSQGTCGTIPWTPGSQFTQYRDLYGNVYPLFPGSSVNIGASPLLLENQSSE